MLLSGQFSDILCNPKFTDFKVKNQCLKIYKKNPTTEGHVKYLLSATLLVARVREHNS